LTFYWTFTLQFLFGRLSLFGFEIASFIGLLPYNSYSIDLAYLVLKVTLFIGFLSYNSYSVDLATWLIWFEIALFIGLLPCILIRLT